MWKKSETKVIRSWNTVTKKEPLLLQSRTSKGEKINILLGSVFVHSGWLDCPGIPGPRERSVSHHVLGPVFPMPCQNFVLLFSACGNRCYFDRASVLLHCEEFEHQNPQWVWQSPGQGCSWELLALPSLPAKVLWNIAFFEPAPHGLG